uniref:Uncharacterized protein n=1 Tax=Glossina palpalis gambiensis TaxID=67801 RepID=A0A1B0AXT5_9MUSC
MIRATIITFTITNRTMSSISSKDKISLSGSHSPKKSSVSMDQTMSPAKFLSIANFTLLAMVREFNEHLPRSKDRHLGPLKEHCSLLSDPNCRDNRAPPRCVGYSQSKSKPSKLYLRMNEVTCCTNFPLVTGSETMFDSCLQESISSNGKTNDLTYNENGRSSLTIYYPLVNDI